jgi:hypothetical protein
MTRQFFSTALTVTLCFAVSLAHGEARGREGEKSRGGSSQGKKQGEGKPRGKQSEEARGGKPGGNQPLGGDWSERTHSGKQASGEPEDPSRESGATGAAAGLTAGKNKARQASGAQGAAAANRNSPKVSGAQGAAAGAAAANRNSPKVSGAQGAAAGAAALDRSGSVSGAHGAAVGYAAVRNSFDHPNMYGAEWYGAHPGVWAPAGWAAGAAWVPATWGAIATQCAYRSTTPMSYNYGVNVIAQDGNVIANGQNMGTTVEFSQQAADLAQKGTEAEPSDTEPWLPVGVFAMVRNENQHPQIVVQLAIDGQGILRGNYTDEVTDHTLPIHGAVDKKTLRAAWTVGDNKQTVMEAGIKDLTGSEAPALIHKNGKTDHWLLVRLDQPQPEGNDAAK